MSNPVWWCPWCDDDFPKGQQCNCAPCEGCGAKAYWACTCPGASPALPLPDEKGNIRPEDLPF